MSMHTGERPYNRMTCEQSFLLAQTFKQHMATYTGEQAYRSATCGKSFSKNAGLKLLQTHTQKAIFSIAQCVKNHLFALTL